MSQCFYPSFKSGISYLILSRVILLNPLVTCSNKISLTTANYLKASQKYIHPSTENVISAMVNRELPFINSSEESKVKAKRAVQYYLLVSWNKAIVVFGGGVGLGNSEKEHFVYLIFGHSRTSTGTVSARTRSGNHLTFCSPLSWFGDELTLTCGTRQGKRKIKNHRRNPCCS